MPQNKRILIVDDQQDLREQLAKLLTRPNKKSETVSLVKQMRARLLGSTPEPEPEEPSDIIGYEVDSASQGQDALEMVKKAIDANKPYAVMFLDMRMPPGWDGLETARRVREVDRLIEIVIMTAYADHDQETISSSVGTPHKLLYIKKPFQSEEIFQLALCLTSKWSVEEDERQRKSWLENLIRGMGKIKAVKVDKPGEACASVLKSLLTFMGSQRGFVASLPPGERKWKLEFASNIENADAVKFIEENESRLSESRTTQCIGGNYFLPLRREGYSAVAVIYDTKAPNDAEWFKLLSLLVMTASEVMSSANAQDDLFRHERDSSLAAAGALVATEAKGGFDTLLAGLSGLRANSAFPDALKPSLKELELAADGMRAGLAKIASLDEKEPLKDMKRADLVAILQELSETLRKDPPQGISVRVEISGLPEAQTLCVPELVKEAILSILSISLAAAAGASIKELEIKFAVRSEGGFFKLQMEDNGPGVSPALRRSVFEPFANRNAKDKLGLALPLAHRIFSRHGWTLLLSPERTQGNCFTASIPAAPAESSKQ